MERFFLPGAKKAEGFSHSVPSARRLFPQSKSGSASVSTNKYNQVILNILLANNSACLYKIVHENPDCTTGCFVLRASWHRRRFEPPGPWGLLHPRRGCTRPLLDQFHGQNPQFRVPLLQQLQGVFQRYSQRRQLQTLRRGTQALVAHNGCAQLAGGCGRRGRLLRVRHKKRAASLRVSTLTRQPLSLRGWGDRWDSNPRLPESQSGALPLNYSHH